SRTIVLSPTAFSEYRDVKQPEDLTHTIRVDPSGIGAIYFGASPQELLLQCEKFTNLGSLKPLTGATFNPAGAENHILIPAGGQISTRFECGVADRYQVLYRTVRRGMPANAEITLDGKPLKAVQGQPSRDVQSRPETSSAGIVELTKGIHTLVL